jgi:hypothetical protein
MNWLVLPDDYEVVLLDVERVVRYVDDVTRSETSSRGSRHIAALVGLVLFGCGARTIEGSDGGAVGDAAEDAVADTGIVVDTGLPDTGDAGPLPDSCPAFDPSLLAGETPFGTWAMQPDDFAVLSCPDGAFARARFYDASTDRSLVIPIMDFTVATDPSGLSFVADSFETDITITDSGGEERALHQSVAVRRWRETADPAGHEIDLTMTLTGAGFDLTPVVIRGRFCDWMVLDTCPEP